MQYRNKLFSAEVIILLLVVAVCIYVFFASAALSAEAKLFPQVISGITFLFSAYAIVRNLIVSAKEEQKTQEDTEKVRKLNHFFLLAIAVLYVLLLEWLGFLLCTIALFIAMPVMLGNRNFKVLIPMAIIASLLFYLVFKKAFYVALPQGIITFI